MHAQKRLVGSRGVVSATLDIVGIDVVASLKEWRCYLEGVHAFVALAQEMNSGVIRLLTIVQHERSLAVAEFAMNNAWNSSIQNTPFMLNYGQNPDDPTIHFLRQRNKSVNAPVDCIVQSQPPVPPSGARPMPSG